MHPHTPRPTPPTIALGLALFILAIGFYLSLRSFLRVQTSEQALFVEAPFLLLVSLAAVGVVLIGRGWPHREGTRLHCARCGHPWAPELDKLQSQCQECGAPWRHYGGRIEGRLVQSRWLILAGLALIALALSSPVMKSALPFFAATNKSTTRLMRAVAGASWDAAADDWKELMARTLSVDEERSLAISIINRRARDGTLPTELALWVQSRVDLGTLPSDLTERWFSEMFAAALDVPGAVTLGEPLRIVARARFNGPWNNAVYPARVFVQGLTLDGYPGVTGRDQRTRPAERFSAGATLFEEMFTPEQAGTLRVRLVAWFVLGKIDAVAYDDAGDPNLGSSLYTRRFVLEKDVEVLEPRR